MARREIRGLIGGGWSDALLSTHILPETGVIHDFIHLVIHAQIG